VDAPQEIEVVLRVYSSGSPPPIPPVLSASPSTLSFTATAGGANPSPDTVSVSNAGWGTVNWEVFTKGVWLTATPASGTNSGTVTVAVDTEGLPVGTYTGEVKISDPTALLSPRIVTVTLTLN